MVLAYVYRRRIIQQASWSYAYVLYSVKWPRRRRKVCASLAGRDLQLGSLGLMTVSAMNGSLASSVNDVLIIVVVVVFRCCSCACVVQTSVMLR